MNKKRLVILLLFGLIMFRAFKLADSRALSFHFVDEEDHIVFADYMNQGYRLYQDLSSNHSPLVYLGSSWIQKIVKPNSIYLLIKTHRLAIFAYSLIWSLLLVWRFEWIGLGFIALFEYLKYFLFGNLFLMESLAVYPAVYLLGIMLKSGLEEKWPGRAESVWLGVCSFLVMFNLLPLWPWLAGINLVFWLKNKKKFIWQSGTLIILSIFLFTLIPFKAWFKETIYNNYVYALPQLSTTKLPTDWLKLFFFPWLAWVTPNSLQAGFIRLFSSFWLVLGINWLMKKDKRLGWLAISYLFLTLANLRVLSPGEVFYGGFHLLPWLGLLIITSFFWFKTLWKDSQLRWLITGATIIWSGGLLANQSMPYFWQTDPGQEYHINYSTFDNLNFAVKSLAQPGDRLAVLTSESLIYWQTQVKPATRQIVYYAWEHSVPELQREYEAVLSPQAKNPPEFVYGGDSGDWFKKIYTNLYKDEKATNLFFKKDRLQSVTPSQIEKLNSRNFILEKTQL
jgi:hypothetical protein